MRWVSIMALTLNIPEEKAEKVIRLLDMLADNSDAIESLLRTLSRLKESGMLAALEGLAEGFDEGFNYMARAEMMAAIGNLMMLLYMLSRIDQPMLFEIAEKLPKGLNLMYEEIKAPKKKASIMELLALMRSPEIFALMSAMRSMLKSISSKG
ncbi:conserved protein of unknown function [Candidatus Nitrosocaldus cavascurensis]|jgi:uncharacterized protein YjgD (DUF1641 family)|uniref:DUF1641 domain-containing protein n=2 Tax=Candidatus Nitrosocaldaceae TaxID=1968910 RepID=A0A2K5ANR3_9ARCH|nr:conserved protein of unknown function [Candidatus Nitrosocaldus cavascurensis]